MDQRGDRRHVFSAPEPINLRGAIEFRLDQTLVLWTDLRLSKVT